MNADHCREIFEIKRAALARERPLRDIELSLAERFSALVEAMFDPVRGPFEEKMTLNGVPLVFDVWDPPRTPGVLTGTRSYPWPGQEMLGMQAALL